MKKLLVAMIIIIVIISSLTFPSLALESYYYNPDNGVYPEIPLTEEYPYYFIAEYYDGIELNSRLYISNKPLYSKKVEIEDTGKEKIIIVTKGTGNNVKCYYYHGTSPTQGSWRTTTMPIWVNEGDGTTISGSDFLNLDSSNSAFIPEVNYVIRDYDNGIAFKDPTSGDYAYISYPVNLYAINHLTHFPDIQIRGNEGKTLYIQVSEDREGYGDYVQTKSFVIDMPFEREYNISSSMIPYGYNPVGIRLYDDPAKTNLLDEVYIQIDPPDYSFVKIDGLTSATGDILNFDKMPDFVFRKYLKPEYYSVYFDDTLIYASLASVKTENKTIYGSSLPFSIGTHTVYIKNENAQVVSSYTFEVLRPSTPTNPNDPTEPTSPEHNPLNPPDRSEYEDGIFGDIGYGLELLMYYISYPFILLGEGVRTIIGLFENGFEWVGQLSSMIGSWLAFLPRELTALITGAISCVFIGLIISLIKAVK